VNAGAVGVDDAAATLQLELPAMPGAAEDRPFPLPVELARFESAMVPVTNPRQSGAPWWELTLRSAYRSPATSVRVAQPAACSDTWSDSSTRQ
jgi:hypothetical protein